jgi:hypothetical protein
VPFVFATGYGTGAALRLAQGDRQAVFRLEKLKRFLLPAFA